MLRPRAIAVVLLLGAATTLTAAPAPTVDEAKAFVERAQAELLDLWVAAERASWVQSTFITFDTEEMTARANAAKIAATVRLAKEATRFDGLDLPADLARKLKLLKLSLTLPAPSDAGATAELARIAASLEGAYGRGKYCPRGKDSCLTLEQLDEILATSRDPKQLLDAWVGWHAIAPPMRPEYARLVELANQGARELGFPDVGAMWRSKYDMDPNAFAAEVDRLWLQVKPLYDSLHCYVRSRLSATYGPEVVPKTGPIPAHLLGNMWAQEWGNLYDLVAPPAADPGFDLTQRLVAKKVDPLEMVKVGERFFLSLGFPPLPATFWERSMFTRPRDREVVCHASAWDIDWADDLRLKMCIEVNQTDFVTIHHELGHNFYQRAYNQLAPLYRDSANDGFHEAIGDTLALSITPPYLLKLGLIEKAPPESADLALQMRSALDKVAFLPFGLLVDRFRWSVFSGEVGPDQYNAAWWKLRERYQGVKAPVARSEADFDPGAKYHIPANVPYTRYFLATILQFQFHRALCQAAGFDGPLNRCSIYGSEAAGKRLRDTLAMGQSRPWPDALEALTGQREMDATAMLEYYAPLKKWLDEQNAGQTCGW